MLKKEKNEHEVIEFGHGPVGPSPCRVNRSAETVLYIRLTNNKRSVQRLEENAEQNKLRNAIATKEKCHICKNCVMQSQPKPKLLQLHKFHSLIIQK
jgi:hypothetical protein